MTSVDQRVCQHVLEELRHDIRIDSTNVGVDVHDGIVHLSGTVLSYAQKVIAGQIVQRIKGVVGIENDLVVTVAQPCSDQEIQNTVESNVFSDVRIASPEKIKVVVANGVVTLMGSVPNYYEKNAAEDDSWTTSGVVNVVNNIVAAPPVVRTDAQISDEVRAALAEDPVVNAVNVNLCVVRGMVYPRGTVPSYAQIQQAASDAWGVAGVVDLVNGVPLTSTVTFVSAPVKGNCAASHSSPACRCRSRGRGPPRRPPSSGSALYGRCCPRQPSNHRQTASRCRRSRRSASTEIQARPGRSAPRRRSRSGTP
ncbi:MAG TPA: BON domain-containing protein [Chloroflexota bacterium]|nr:BON domain-containing protein [Chloroflexota bacterium]